MTAAYRVTDSDIDEVAAALIPVLAAVAKAADRAPAPAGRRDRYRASETGRGRLTCTVCGVPLADHPLTGWCVRP